MNDIIATIIEGWLGYYDDVFSDVMYENWVYGWSLISFTIPFIVLFVFYKLIDTVGGQLWHYLLAVFMSFLFVFIANILLLYFFIADDDGFFMFAFEYVLFITLLSVIPIIIATFGIKIFSTNNKHNPF